MGTVHKLSAGTGRTSGIAAQSVASGANFLGSEIDNSSNKDKYLDLHVLADFGTGPTADSYLEFYVLYKEGSVYEDGDATPVDPKKAPDAVMPLKNVTTDQNWSSRRIPLKPFPFKILVKSETNQTATVTVSARTWNEDTP